jgi:predicted TIM-barrel fold metal-dependent hydrolase
MAARRGDTTPMSRKAAPEPEERLPIKLDPVSNGEFFPDPASPETRAAQALAWSMAEEGARRTGRSRRDFLRSACGAAATLLAMNASYGCARRGAGGSYGVPKEAALDEAAAQSAVGGDEFIFDVQTHHVTPERDWMKNNRTLDFLPYSAEGWCAEKDLSCYTRDRFIKEVFLDSDTDVAVLSALAGAPRDNPLTTEEAAATREAVEKLGRDRLMIHGIVMPNLGPLKAQLEGMQALAETWKVKAWKLYTVWGPEGRGYFLDDPELGLPVIEQGRRLGVKLFTVHKGLPLPGMEPSFTRCRDIGAVAKLFPDVNFMVYHSGFENPRMEGPYNPAAVAGVDTLVKSLQDHGIGPNANVYAELGATWKLLMAHPTAAAHVLGKLLKYVGEDRVLWGTDSIWFGSPQDQIQAFRAFEISEEFQEKYGYPKLTKELKAKVFGLSAAKPYGVDPTERRAKLRADTFGVQKALYQEAPTPSHQAYGPRTRTEVLSLLRRGGGHP